MKHLIIILLLWQIAFLSFSFVLSFCYYYIVDPRCYLNTDFCSYYNILSIIFYINKNCLYIDVLICLLIMISYYIKKFDIFLYIYFNKIACNKFVYYCRIIKLSILIIAKRFYIYFFHLFLNIIYNNNNKIVKSTYFIRAKKYT